MLGGLRRDCRLHRSACRVLLVYKIYQLVGETTGYTALVLDQLVKCLLVYKIHHLA